MKDIPLPHPATSLVRKHPASKVSELNKNYLLVIGKGAVNAQRRAFQDQTISRYEDIDKVHVMREIGEVDPLGQGAGT